MKSQRFYIIISLILCVDGRFSKIRSQIALAINDISSDIADGATMSPYTLLYIVQYSQVT